MYKTYLWQIWSCIPVRVWICADSLQWQLNTHDQCEEKHWHRRWELWCNMVSSSVNDLCKSSEYCRRAEAFCGEHAWIISALLFVCEWEYSTETSSRDSCEARERTSGSAPSQMSYLSNKRPNNPSLLEIHLSSLNQELFSFIVLCKIRGQ